MVPTLSAGDLLQRCLAWYHSHFLPVAARLCSIISCSVDELGFDQSIPGPFGEDQ
jgi:hypothetical protein